MSTDNNRTPTTELDPSLFSSLKAGFTQDDQAVASQQAVERWPLLKSSPPKAWASVPMLSPLEKDQRRLGSELNPLATKVHALARNPRYEDQHAQRLAQGLARMRQTARPQADVRHPVEAQSQAPRQLNSVPRQFDQATREPAFTPQAEAHGAPQSLRDIISRHDQGMTTTANPSRRISLRARLSGQ